MQTGNHSKVNDDEVAVLVRVRNRLAMSPDEKLPHILKGLLPRLLRKLDALVVTTTTTGSREQPQQSSTLILHQQQQQQHVSGMLAYAVERIRVLYRHNKQQRPPPRNYDRSDWILEVLKVALDDRDDSNHRDDNDDSTCKSKSTTVSQTMALWLVQAASPVDHPAALPLLGRAVNRFASVETPAARQLWEQAAWLWLDGQLCLDQESSSSSNNNNTNNNNNCNNNNNNNNNNNHHHYNADDSRHYHIVPVHVHVTGGLLELVLDVAVYSKHAVPRFGLDAQDSSSGLSPVAFERLDKMKRNNTNHHQQQQGSTDVDWHKLKFVTLQYALQQAEGTPQSHLLVAFFAQSTCPLGLLVSQKVIQPTKQEREKKWYACVQGVWKKCKMEQQQLQPTPDFSMALVCSLAILLVGDAVAWPLVESSPAHHSIRPKLEEIRCRPPSKDLDRPSVPWHFAARVSANLKDNIIFSCKDVWMEEWDMILLYLDLVSALQQRQDCTYIGMELLYPIYKSFRQHQDSIPNGQIVLDHCMGTARAVVEGQVHRLWPHNRLPAAVDPWDENLPLGAVRPMGQRAGLHRRLQEHRSYQRQSRLRQSDAAEARRIAYELLGAASVTDDLAVPALLLECISTEEVPHLVDRAREALGQQLGQVTSSSSSFTPRHAWKILPAIFAALASESAAARCVAATWTAAFLAPLDRGMAQHIGSYLVDDPDGLVRAAARQCPRDDDDDEGMEILMMTDYPVMFLDLDQPVDAAVIGAMMHRNIHAVGQVTGLPPFIAAMVLHDNAFDVSLCCADKGGVLENSLLVDKYAVLKKEDKATVCEICFEECNARYSKGCGHSFCKECWHDYFVSLLLEVSGDPLVATCPNHSCVCRITRNDVSVLRENYLLVKWDAAYQRAYIERSKIFFYCRGPNCKAIAHNPEGRQVRAQCPTCSTEFCSGCGASEPHEPATCHSWEKWQSAFQDSSFWVKKNTKPCPSCGVPIEKDHGCNHMKCSQCSANYCWLCLVPLRSHMEPHVCNRFDPVTAADNPDQARDLFFSERFQRQEDFEFFAKDSLRRRLRVPRADDESSTTHRQLLLRQDTTTKLYQQASSALILGRRFLKFSYVQAWAGQRHGHDDNELYEEHQATLEFITERLNTELRKDYDWEKTHFQSSAGASDVERFLKFLMVSLRLCQGRIMSSASPSLRG